MARQPKKKGKAAEIAARQQQVSELVRQGKETSEIAIILGVSKKTVIADRRVLRKGTVTSIREVVASPAGSLQEALAIYDTVIEKAEEMLSGAGHPATKNAFLRTIAEANSAKLKVMMDLGILQRAPTRGSLAVLNIDGVDLQNASSGELIALERALRAQAAGKGIDVARFFESGQSSTPRQEAG